MSDTTITAGRAKPTRTQSKAARSSPSIVHQIAVAVQTDPLTAKQRRTHTIIHLKRPNWSLLCFSVAIMATVAITFSFGVSLTAIVMRWKEGKMSDTYETNSTKDKPSSRSGSSISTNETEMYCREAPMDPPNYPCILWDWDEVSLQAGTKVSYYCDGGVVKPMSGPVLTLICKGDKLRWAVVDNRTESCDCNLVTGIYNNVGYSQR